MIRKVRIALSGLSLLLVACSGQEQEVAVKPAVPVEVAAATTTDLLETIPVTGTLSARRSADIKSELPGVYREIYVSDWVPVRKGQPLARIEAAETSAHLQRAVAGAERARVEAARAAREAQRQRSLREVGLATQQQLDEAESTREATAAAQQAAAEEAAQLRLRLDKSVLRAPFDGVLAQRNVNVGDLAGADAGGKVVFRVVDNRQLELTISVPATELGRLAVGQPLTFHCDGLPGEDFSGTIRYLNPSVSTADRSLQVKAEIDNRSGRLRDGLFVSGQIVTGRRTALLLVPRNVLAGFDPQGGTANLFVVVDDIARRRPVKTGAVSGERVEIRAGLQPGEHYVTRGAFNLRDGDRVSVTAPPVQGGGQ